MTICVRSSIFMILFYHFQEICLQTKLLAPVNESVSDFLSKAPDAPPFMVTRAAVNILKVYTYTGYDSGRYESCSNEDTN